MQFDWYLDSFANLQERNPTPERPVTFSCFHFSPSSLIQEFETPILPLQPGKQQRNSSSKCPRRSRKKVGIESWFPHCIFISHTQSRCLVYVHILAKYLVQESRALFYRSFFFRGNKYESDSIVIYKLREASTQCLCVSNSAHCFLKPTSLTLTGFQYKLDFKSELANSAGIWGLQFCLTVVWYLVYEGLVCLMLVWAIDAERWDGNGGVVEWLFVVDILSQNLPSIRKMGRGVSMEELTLVLVY